MKKIIYFIVALFSLTFCSCSHRSIKNDVLNDSDFCFVGKILNSEVVKRVLNDENCVSYSTEEDENGNLQSVQVVDAKKIAGVKYVNSSSQVSSGDFAMIIEKGPFVYVFKCNEKLPFRSRIDEAHHWCAKNLDISRFFNAKNLSLMRYQHLVRIR